MKKLAITDESYICGAAFKSGDRKVSTFAPLTPEDSYFEIKFTLMERSYSLLKDKRIYVCVYYMEFERLVKIKQAPFIEDYANLVLAEAGTTDFVLGNTHATASFS